MGANIVEISESGRRLKAAGHISKMSQELSGIADKADLPMLAYLLRLVETEAANCIKANKQAQESQR